MKLRDWLVEYAPKLQARGFDAPVRVLRQLAAFRLELDEAKLLAEPDYVFNEGQARQLNSDSEALAQGVPLAYLYGSVPFLQLDLKVDKRGLIPRPETEFLTQQIIDQLNACDRQPQRILDLCTGTGAIGLALAKAFPQAQVWLTDLDEQALSLAQENAELNQLAKQCHFRSGDLWQAVESEAPFDVIVANPPYIDRSETLPDSVTGHEPHMALFSEDEGMAHIKRILYKLPDYLNTPGLAAFELSHRHRDLLTAHLSKHPLSGHSQWREDPWHIPRFLWIKSSN